MARPLCPELAQMFERARLLHDRAASDYDKCAEFNRLMSELMDRLEDEGQERLAGKVMSLLLDCHPKEGAQCDKSQLVGDKIKKLAGGV